VTSGSAPAPYHRDWYESVSGDSLRQGDIFRNLLVYWLPQDLVDTGTDPQGEAQSIRAEYHRGAYIILSASCDVDQRGYDQVLLTRIVDATHQTLKVQTEKEFHLKLEVLRQGLVPSQFLLAAHPEVSPVFPLSVVQYKVHSLLPIQYVKRCCTGERLRLRSPHRERFGTWAGANLSRVGPENDSLIPRFTQIYAKDILAAVERE
jgi:hypothetical protein